MATSSSKDFELDVSDYIEEAFERCGLEVRTGYDLKTAKRSLNLMLADWANRGLNQWTISQTSITLATDIAEYPAGTLTMSVGASGSFTVGETITGGTSAATTTLAAAVDLTDFKSTIDFLSVAIRRDGTDYAADRLSREAYLNIPTKTTTGRPSQFFLDRQIQPVLKIWPAPENSTDVIIFNRLMRMDDADTFTNNMEIPFRFYPCLAAGLAYYLSMKRAPNRIPVLKSIYEEEFERAMVEDRDRASFNITPNVTGTVIA